MHQFQRLQITTWLILVWFLTFSVAFVNGDDVVHLIGRQTWDLYFPVLQLDWQPTRCIQYFRGIITLFMDLLYFPLRDYFGLSFFQFFRFFNACISTIFIGLTFFYIKNLARGIDNSNDKIYAKSYYLLLISMTMVGIIYLFPWKNQVHLISYYLAGVLSFICLCELSLIGQNSLNIQSDRNSPRIYMFPTLAFISVYSHEGYALTILTTLIIFNFSLYLISTRKNMPLIEFRMLMNGSYIYFAIFTALISIISMIIFYLYSSRLAQSESETNLVLRVAGLIFSNKYLVIFYLLISFGYLVNVLSTNKIQSRKIKFLTYIFGQGRQEALFTNLMGCSAIFSNLIVVILISAATKQNYLDHQAYPWGGLLIVCDVFSLCYLVNRAIGSFNLSARGRGVLLLVLFIGLTRLTFVGLLNVAGEASKLRQVQNAYLAFLDGKETVIETGLSLAKIPTQVRPLPDGTISDEFKQAYSDFFLKYYGKTGNVVFR